MGMTKIIGIVLIALGALGLVYGGFSYDKQKTAASIGPIELKVTEKETVNVPMIVSGAAIAAGVLLLVVGKSK